MLKIAMVVSLGELAPPIIKRGAPKEDVGEVKGEGERFWEVERAQ